MQTDRIFSRRALFAHAFTIFGGLNFGAARALSQVIDSAGLTNNPTSADLLATTGVPATPGVSTTTGLSARPDASVKFILTQPDYKSVRLSQSTQNSQLEHCTKVLMELSEDSMLRPFRQLARQSAPGVSVGGWYSFNPDYDPNKKGSDGFAPGHAFGQWVSALARVYASTREPALKKKVERLLTEFDKTITATAYSDMRFPAYTYDKLLRALLDAASLCELDCANGTVNKLTDAFEPHLPSSAVPRLREWNKAHPGDSSYTWDESYTLPENLYVAYLWGYGDRYLHLANRFLENETFFEPLARGENSLVGKHAYSYVNALSSSAMAYVTTGRKLYLDATTNGFDRIAEQSFATGGWGPDETFVKPGQGALFASLTKTHNSFETPCGSYAHFKLCRYLLQLTGDGKYGDSMERIMYNTVLGALPLEIPGKAFYYMDNNVDGRKVYHSDVCPCCAGTLPQVASDYGINSYFLDPQGAWINLYTPSSMRWTQDGSLVEISQHGSYPYEGTISVDVSVERPIEFALRFRVPSWVGDKVAANYGAQVDARVNDEPIDTKVVDGFASHTRRWKKGDVLTIQFELPVTLQPVDAENPNVVAVLRGPLVLFALDSASSQFKRDDLLSIRQLSNREWACASDRGVKRFAPFESIKSETYSTYVRVV